MLIQVWIIRAGRRGGRRRVLQLFQFGLNFRPVFWFALHRVRSIRMAEEFQKFGPKLRRSTAEILLGQLVEQLCLRLIVELIFSRARDFAGVEIVVGQVQLSGACLAQQLPVAIQGRVEARFE